MIMADVLTWFLIVVGTLLVLNAHWLCAFALFPRLVEACGERYGRRPVLATLLGLAVLLPVLLGGIWIGKTLTHPAIRIALILGSMGPALLALSGSAGLALRVGRGLRSAADVDAPWRAVLRGGSALSLAFVLPILGWFVLLPWALVSGTGAALLTWVGSRARDTEIVKG